MVAGDFDADEMVEKIKKVFGTMKRGKNIVPSLPEIPEIETPKAHVYQEPRLPFFSSSIIIRLPEENVLKNRLLKLKLNNNI